MRSIVREPQAQLPGSGGDDGRAGHRASSYDNASSPRGGERCHRRILGADIEVQPAGGMAQRPLQLCVLQKAKVSSPVEDDVVQQLDAYDFARRFELGGDVDVALRRFNTTAGVIVGNDDSRSTVGQCIRKDFARMNRAPVNQANRNDADVQDFVRAVDAGA